MGKLSDLSDAELDVYEKSKRNGIKSLSDAELSQLEDISKKLASKSFGEKVSDFMNQPEPTEQQRLEAYLKGQAAANTLATQNAKLFNIPLNAAKELVTTGIAQSQGQSPDISKAAQRVNPFSKAPATGLSEVASQAGIPSGPEFGVPEKITNVLNKYISRPDAKIDPKSLKTTPLGLGSNIAEFLLASKMPAWVSGQPMASPEEMLNIGGGPPGLPPAPQTVTKFPTVSLPGGNFIRNQAKQAKVNNLVQNIEQFRPELVKQVSEAEKNFYQKQIVPRMLEQESRLAGKTIKINPDEYMGFDPELDKYLQGLKSAQGQYIEYPFGKFKKSDIPPVQQYKWENKSSYEPKTAWDWYNEQVPVRTTELDIPRTSWDWQNEQVPVMSTKLDIPERQLVIDPKTNLPVLDPLTQAPVYKEPTATTTTEYKNIPKPIKREPIATTETEFKTIPKAVPRQVFEKIERPIATKETVPGYPENVPSPNEIEIPATEALKIRAALNKASEFKSASQYKGTSEPMHEAAYRKGSELRGKIYEVDPNIEPISSELQKANIIKDEALQSADTNLNNVVKGTDLGKQSNLKRFDILSGSDLSGFGKRADKAQKMYGKSRAQGFIGGAKEIPYRLLGQVERLTGPMSLAATEAGIPDILDNISFDTWLKLQQQKKPMSSWENQSTVLGRLLEPNKENQQ